MKTVSSTAAFGKCHALGKRCVPPRTPTPPPQKKCADESLESLEISICCCCIGICWDCTPIIDDLEKAPIKIPQTPSIADVNNLESVVNLMACTHCSLTGNLHGSILTVLLSSENRIISSKNLFCRIFHLSDAVQRFVWEMQF